MLWFIIVLLVVGFLAGALARLLVPGPDPMSLGATWLLGVLGSFLGGFLGYVLFGADVDDGVVQVSGIIGSVIGAVILLLDLPRGAAASVATGVTTSTHKAAVDRYFDGFRGSDHTMILSCLTDDVVWDLPGFRHLDGQGGVRRGDREPRVPGLAASSRSIASWRKTTWWSRSGVEKASRRTGERIRFAFCDVFTFRGDLICRVESYLVPLTG